MSAKFSRNFSTNFKVVPGKIGFIGRREKFSYRSRFKIDNNTGTGRILKQLACQFSLNGRGEKDPFVSIVILDFSL